MTDQTDGRTPASSAPPIDEKIEQIQQSDGQQPTTTHAEWGAGDPHLRITSPEEDRTVFALREDRVTIGSGSDCSLRIPDADAVHATIVHDERDEYVLTLHGAGEMNANPTPGEEGDRSEILRTGAHFTIAGWQLVFGREEYADHGRPFGGREGGELDDQPPQPVRPDYIAERRDDEPHGGLEVKDG
ncbi:FHA domain-containing protein [Microbacterium esteraromaticum]|uniref:FHA domain-containing protein n=1 Tax=Microbacterium esteraromaticum TaxID=57043 RepID=UPI00217559A4|nr:FHA domain-containing protein [Microbacterium esteraromaticum]